MRDSSEADKKRLLEIEEAVARLTEIQKASEEKRAEIKKFQESIPDITRNMQLIYREISLRPEEKISAWFSLASSLLSHHELIVREIELKKKIHKNTRGEWIDETGAVVENPYRDEILAEQYKLLYGEKTDKISKIEIGNVGGKFKKVLGKMEEEGNLTFKIEGKKKYLIKKTKVETVGLAHLLYQYERAKAISRDKLGYRKQLDRMLEFFRNNQAKIEKLYMFSAYETPLGGFNRILEAPSYETAGGTPIKI